jgi:hypothetical protein
VRPVGGQDVAQSAGLVVVLWVHHQESLFGGEWCVKGVEHRASAESSSLLSVSEVVKDVLLRRQSG